MFICVICINDISMNSVWSKCNVVSVFMSVVINSCIVIYCVNVWDRCFLFFVYKEGIVME